MNFLLITNTAIIKQIFTLVTKKLNIKLDITNSANIDKKYDVIVLEDSFINDISLVSNYAKKIGLIGKDKSNNIENIDFLISKPFLPSTLLLILQEQLDNLKTVTVQNNDNKSDEDKEVSESLDFIDTLVEDISTSIIDESDESIVSSAFVKDGGILDSSELSKIQNMLDYSDNDKADVSGNVFEENENITSDEWIDLADIIDKAIDEVREYKFNVKEPIRLTLNDYSMKEIEPLLNKLDQSIIDALVSGEEISLKLKVGTSS